MLIIFFMVFILFIALSLLCVLLANSSIKDFSLKEEDNIPGKDRLIQSLSTKGRQESVINPGIVADNLIYHTVIAESPFVISNECEGSYLVN